MSVPSTLEGAFMLHLMVDVDWDGWNDLKSKRRHRLTQESGEMLQELFERKDREEAGAAYHLLGHKGDLLLVFARQTSQELAEVERQLTQLPIWPYLQVVDSYYSVVELSLHGVAERNRTTLQKQGLEEGTPEWDQALEAILEKDRKAQRSRLYPELPNEHYICFYPMSKKRGEEKNWFMLTSQERAKMMASHGKTGRRYTGKVTQIVSSSMGLDDYDWGVDLFAADPLWFKKLIYEMRYDEVSAVYAEFGRFFIGLRLDPTRLLDLRPWDEELDRDLDSAEDDSVPA